MPSARGTVLAAFDSGVRQASHPDIPETAAPFAGAQQKVAALLATKNALQMLEGQGRDLVLRRRRLAQETAARSGASPRSPAVHLGFDNPALEKFGVRSEDWSRRRRKAPEKEKVEPKG